MTKRLWQKPAHRKLLQALTPEARKRLEGNNPGTDPGSQSNPGESSPPSPFPDQISSLGVQIALPDVLTIGQSLAMLERQASSLVGGICSCEMAASRLTVGRQGVWKNINWEPVTFMPSLRSIRPVPGRVWMVSGWSTGYLRCVSCGGRSAVVSAELSGVALVTTLHSMLANTPPKRRKPAR